MTDATPDQPGTDLVISQAAPPAIGPPAPAEWDALKEQVAYIVKAGALPPALRGKPADIMLVMLAGREAGIGPIHALSKIHVIEGRPTMSAELMAGLVHRAGHELTIVDTTNERCEVFGRRRGAERGSTFVFTMEDAQKANLVKKGPWQQYPANMLRARCIANICRSVFPDVLMGISYVPEEMGAHVDPITGELSKPDEDLVSEADVVAFTERIMALSDEYRGQLRDTMKERGWVLKRLPVRLRADFLAELEGLEGWESMGKQHEAPADDEVAEATIVDDASGDDEDGASTPDAEIAEVVPAPDPAPGPAPSADARPGPPSAGQLAPTPKQLQRIAIACGEITEAHGLDRGHKDEVRHAFVRWVTDGRVDSGTKMTRDEASRAIDLLGGDTWELIVTGEADRPCYFQTKETT